VSASEPEQLVIDSRLESIEDARAWLRALLATSDPPEEWVIELEYALTEALSNVVLHAYRGEPGHEIRLEVHQHDDRVTVAVRDFGERFERAELPPVELDSAREGGYGVFLIESLVDEVVREQAQPHGTRLSLTKMRPLEGER
jgi:serine/threonine-protein kinase RsbW